MSNSVSETSIIISIISLIVVIIIFVAIWMLGGVLFGLFDNMRGLGDDKLQEVFRELLVPIIGGYLAMAFSKAWFPRASTKFVFLGFSAVIFVMIGAYIGFVGPLADKIGESFFGLFLSVISIASAVCGAYIYAKDEM